MTSQQSIVRIVGVEWKYRMYGMYVCTLLIERTNERSIGSIYRIYVGIAQAEDDDNTRERAPGWCGVGGWVWYCGEGMRCCLLCWLAKRRYGEATPLDLFYTPRACPASHTLPFAVQSRSEYLEVNGRERAGSRTRPNRRQHRRPRCPCAGSLSVLIPTPASPPKRRTILIWKYSLVHAPSKNQRTPDTPYTYSRSLKEPETTGVDRLARLAKDSYPGCTEAATRRRTSH